VAYDWTGRVVWITGASSGIGEALAKALAQKGCQLVLSSRSLEKLQAVSQGMNCPFLLLPFDITQAQEHPNAVAQIEQRFGKLDTVILNAGDCLYVDQNFDPKIFEHMISTNFLSQVYGISASLPLLKKSHNPHIVMISSSVVYLPLPRAEAYGASKAALRYLGESLRIHLANQKIVVSLVYPGFVTTPLTEKNDFSMPGIITAQEAAQKIILGIEKQKRTIAFPRGFILFMRCVALLPEPLKEFLLKKTVRS
jgi:NADP-dependent 3-hydroxy acid dehydrogenase YdfG